MSRKSLLTTSDGKEIAYYTWIPRNEVVGVVQIIHGMAEHAMCYEHFAEKLRAKGFAVYACDLRGHGETAADSHELGYFAPQDGWKRVTDDLFELTEVIRMEHPGAKLFLFGHSMGSFLARTLMIQKGEHYSGIILSGTAAHPGVAGYIGRFLARMAVKRDGGKQPNERLDSMSFGSYNRAFTPAKTRFDWLSRDEESVDNYIKDPLCGFVCTSKFFDDLLTGLIYVHDRRELEAVPKQIPVLLVSGAADPVGKMGKGVKKVYSMFRQIGLQDVSIQLFADDRHEILNELDKNEVENYCINWMQDRLEQGENFR